MARIKDESVERVKAAMEILPLVEDVRPAPQGRRTYKGLCPFHQERTPSFTVSPARGTFKCFGCGEGGDAITFVEKTENLDFVGAIELLARAVRRRARVRRGVARAGAEAPARRAAAGAARARRRVLRARCSGTRRRARRRGSTSRRAGSARRSAASSGSATRPAAPSSRARARRRATRRRSCGPSGSPTAAATTTSSGASSSRSPTRAAASAASRRASSTTTIRCRPSTSTRRRASCSARATSSTGWTRRARRSRSEDRAVVVEGNTDVLALRQAGFAPVVASMGTALTEAQLRELARLTKRLFLCFDADAAGQDATLRGMELARRDGFTVRVVALPPGTDPADDPAALPGAARVAASATRCIAYGSSTRAPATAKARVRPRSALPHVAPDSPERLDAIRLAADLLDLPPETQARLVPSRGSASTAGLVSPRLLDAGTRLERSALAGMAAHESLLPELELLGPEHFDDELHRRARAYLLGQEEADERADGAARRAVRATGRGRDHARDGEPAPPPPARARGAARARERRRRAPGRAPAAAIGIAGGDQGVRLTAGYNGRRQSPVAQLAEHPAVNRRVVGSSPTRGASALFAMRAPHSCAVRLLR